MIGDIYELFKILQDAKLMQEKEYRLFFIVWLVTFVLSSLATAKSIFPNDDDPPSQLPGPKSNNYMFWETVYYICMLLIVTLMHSVVPALCVAAIIVLCGICVDNIWCLLSRMNIPSDQLRRMFFKYERLRQVHCYIDPDEKSAWLKQIYDINLVYYCVCLALVGVLSMCISLLP